MGRIWEELGVGGEREGEDLGGAGVEWEEKAK